MSCSCRGLHNPQRNKEKNTYGVLPSWCLAGVVTMASLMSRQCRVDGWAQHRQEVLSLLTSLCGTDPGTAGTLQNEGMAHIYTHRHINTIVNSNPIQCSVYIFIFFRLNVQRVCVISLAERLVRATDARKVCVQWWVDVKGVWCTFRRVSTKASLNRKRPRSHTCS